MRIPIGDRYGIFTGRTDRSSADRVPLIAQYTRPSGLLLLHRPSITSKTVWSLWIRIQISYATCHSRIKTSVEDPKILSVSAASRVQIDSKDRHTQRFQPATMG